MQRYALVDAAGLIVNVILWDGASEWTPPEGQSAVPDTDPPTAEPGGTYIDGTFTPAP